ncbi:hypothetical protein EYB26_009355 [Talaromyces marneffei]|uniref:uncharacterized protein n=1 Tax=Talaromyces marneffei TaxID=37727 RepID=UPI0012A89397|nr:uncharacterized protein EYB26_009355 [Talaromyces marneffei]QGA21644.1 hypothetical protein EYB26_009355 [Talaromyces marneffei]
MPLPYNRRQDHQLWSSPGEADLMSPAADEQVIWRIVHAVDSMLDRCEETMQHTSRPILCWLRTFQPSPCYLKPFVFLARSTSTSRYRRIWKRFMVFLFRCFRLGAEDQPDDTESDSEDATTDDLDDKARNGAGAAESTDHLSTDLLPPPSLEKLFQLNIIFLIEEFTDGQPSSSLLVYFSGILGFSPDAQSFQPAKSFTPHLSTLIYIQRLLFLEYALPYRDYPTIGWNRRPRRHHLNRLNPIRRRYMIAGALTPLVEFQSLQDYGRTIARTDPPSFLL